MKSPNTLHRTVIYGAMTSVLGLLVACGIDPPPANGTPSETTVAPPTIPGLKPSLDSSLQLVAENSATTKCNIETLGGSNLEGVRPTVDVGKTVGVAGWYTNSAATGLAAADSAPVGGPGDATAAVVPDVEAASVPDGNSAAAEVAGDAGLQLVVVSEDGSKHWVVAVPARTERADVAEAMGDPALLNSGFAFDMNLSELQPGYYSLHLSNKAHAATSVCGLGRGFAVE